MDEMQTMEITKQILSWLLVKANYTTVLVLRLALQWCTPSYQQSWTIVIMYSGDYLNVLSINFSVSRMLKPISLHTHTHKEVWAHKPDPEEAPLAPGQAQDTFQDPGPSTTWLSAPLHPILVNPLHSQPSFVLCLQANPHAPFTQHILIWSSSFLALHPSSI